MSFTFQANERIFLNKNLDLFKTNTIKTVIESRIQSSVEACGANHDCVIGQFVDPSAKNIIEGYAEEGDPDYQRYSVGIKKMLKEARSTKHFSHGLLETVHMAFAYHYPLILTPDSIWLCIAQGFAEHVNQNSELLRKHFVRHEGKQAIILRRDGFVKGSPNNDWQGCFSEFSDRLQEHLGKKRDLIVSNFSTTGPIEKAVSEIVLMDSMKSYFKYGCKTLCGIPEITLAGTEEDWVDILVRAQALSEYELGWWIGGLTPVLEKIAETATGTVDIAFWNSIYKQNGGSGGPYCNGWINTLFPYLFDGRNGMRKNKYAECWDGKGFGGGPTLDAYPIGLSKMPFKWQVYNTTYDMELVGGFVGAYQDPETCSLTPTVGWAMADTGVSRQGPIDTKEDW